jgi:hypothetical protein
MFPSAPVRKYPDESAVNQTTVHASVGIVLPTPDRFPESGISKKPVSAKPISLYRHEIIDVGG